MNAIHRNHHEPIIITFVFFRRARAATRGRLNERASRVGSKCARRVPRELRRAPCLGTVRAHAALGRLRIQGAHSMNASVLSATLLFALALFAVFFKVTVRVAPLPLHPAPEHRDARPPARC